MASALIVHLPHDSTDIPAQYRDQFVLSDEELAKELLAMTDAHTAALFSGICPPENALRASVSRLLVDVERFADDAQEIMASRGMGVIYTQSSQRRPLRRPLRAEERDQLLKDFYYTHHDRFTQRVAAVLRQCGKVLILDAHSFPARPQPSALDQAKDRPDICIGTDDFHTPPQLSEALVGSFAKEGFSVKVNAPYAGAIVPTAYYQQEPAVSSVMIEVNRKLYMDERDGSRLPTFESLAEKVRSCSLIAVQSCGFGC